MTSIFILMEMLKELKMEPAGTSLVNMEKENAKEILLRHVLSKNMIFTLKHFPLLSVLKVTLTIGLQVERNALKLIT